MEEQVVVGEADTSRAGVVRRTINKLIKQTSSNTFDIAILLHEVKTKSFWGGWGFDSFSKWAKSLEIKYTKAFYLVKIVDNMTAADLSREQYEPVGLGKLRIISRLDPEGNYKGTPVVMLIRELTLKAQELSLEEVQFEVDTILGLTEEESMCWWNLRMKKLARENVCVPALRKAKRFMGQQKDEVSGEFKDASDGAAVEMIMANFLADANFDSPEDASEPQPEASNTGDATDSAQADETPEPVPVTEGDTKYSID